MGIQEFARFYAEQFETRTRTSDNQTIYVLKDGAAEAYPILYDMIQNVHRAHGDLPPDNWTYEAIYDALTAIADDTDMEPPHQHHQLTEWLTTNYDYVDEYLKVIGGKDNETSIMEIIQHACGMHLEEIRDQVYAELEEIVAEEEE